MTLFAEQTNTLETISSLFQEESWRARNTELQATETQDIHGSSPHGLWMGQDLNDQVRRAVGAKNNIAE